MAIAFRTSLFFLIGLAAAFNPLKDMQDLAEFRSPLLASLGDLSLSDEDALNQISNRINEVLEIPNDDKHKNFWIDLISRKESFKVSEAPSESISETLKQKLSDEVDQLKAAAQKIKDDAGDNDVDEEVTKAVLAGIRDIAAKVSADMSKLILADARQQFADLVDSTSADKELKIKKHVANDLAELMIEKMNEFIEEFEADIDEDFSNEIQAVLFDAVKLTNPVSHNLAQVLLLVSNGAYMLRIESRYMFAAIQHYTEVPAKDRLSRMLIIARLLVLFGHLNNKLDEVNDLSNLVFAYRQAVVKGDEQEDANFAPLYRALVRDYITILGQQISTETSYQLGKRLLTTAQEITQTHMVGYIKNRIARNSLPHLSLADLPLNSKDYLEVVNAITTLDFKDVTTSWWNEALLGFDKLLAIPPQVLNTLGYASLLLSESFLPLDKHEEFFDTLYAQLLEFLQNNGAQLSPETFGVYFDQYINEVAKRNPLAQKHYLALKTQNIFFITSAPTYSVVFNPYVATIEEAKALGRSLSKDDFKKTIALMFNAYVAGFDKKESASPVNTFVFMKEFSGASVPIERFSHATLNFRVKESAKQKRNVDQYATVQLKFSDGQNDASLIKKEKTPNKIIIDAGEDQIEDLKTPKLVRTDGPEHRVIPTQVAQVEQVQAPQELPSIQIQLSVIPVEKLENLVQEQIQEKEHEEKIENQVNQILEEAQPQQDEVQPKQDSPKDIQPVTQPEADLNQLQGDLSNTEKKILAQKNLKEVLDQIDEITDGEGNTTKFVYVKLIPKLSDCYKTLFG